MPNRQPKKEVYNNEKRSIIALVLAGLVLLASCGPKTPKEEVPTEPPTETENLIPEVDAPIDLKDDAVTDPGSDDGVRTDDQQEADDANLVKNEYKDLEVTAVILERKALLPGMPIKANVTIKTTGTKTVAYAMGSGVAVVPDALTVTAEGLQPVRPKESYGIMTMDFRMATLAAGESVDYDCYIATIKPVEEIDTLAFELMKKDIYLGEVNVEDLKADHPTLEAVEPGAYTAEFSLKYSVVEEGGETDPTGNPTGINTGTLEFTLS